MSSPYDDRLTDGADSDRAAVAAPAPYPYEYPPAGTYTHGYSTDEDSDGPALATRRTIRRSLIVVVAGVLAVLAVLAAFSWFLSARAAGHSSESATTPTVTSVPAPWDNDGGAPDFGGMSSDVDAARAEAETLLGHAGFSRQSLIEVLASGEVGHSFYSEEVATEAVDSLGVDWTEQAQRTAQELVDGDMGFSPSSLYDFLAGEGMSGFTQEEADAGVSAVEADWSAEAVKAARFNLSEGLSTADTLVRDLVAEGFTPEQATEAVSAVSDAPAQRSV